MHVHVHVHAHTHVCTYTYGHDWCRRFIADVVGGEHLINDADTLFLLLRITEHTYNTFQLFTASVLLQIVSSTLHQSITRY